MTDRVFVHPDARVHSSAKIMPGAWVGPNVQIEAEAYIGHNSVIGGMPEHRDYYDNMWDKKSCGMGVYIGPGARIFEFVTVHSGTRIPTAIMRGAAVFNHSHVGHDCVVDAKAIIGGNVSLAGHCHVMEYATISGKSCLVQFCVVGAYAFVGGFTFLTKHAEPGSKYLGFPAKYIGDNDVGLERAGLSSDAVRLQYFKRWEELTKERKL